MSFWYGGKCNPPPSNVFCLIFNDDHPLARREAPTAGRKPAGEGANINRRLVPYTRDAMRTKSRIEFIYLLCVFGGGR